MTDPALIEPPATMKTPWYADDGSADRRAEEWRKEMAAARRRWNVLDEREKEEERGFTRRLTVTFVGLTFLAVMLWVYYL